MNKVLKAALFLFLLILPCSLAYADENYPDTMYTGDLLLVDGHMGTGFYADRSSVVVQNYAPPMYQIAINLVGIRFSEDYWEKHHTYIGGPYKVEWVETCYFRYNWNRKAISYLADGRWLDWDINRNNTWAGGDPRIPNTAEVAFVTAYNMRFFDKTTGSRPDSRYRFRVINDELYQRLGI